MNQGYFKVTTPTGQVVDVRYCDTIQPLTTDEVIAVANLLTELRKKKSQPSIAKCVCPSEYYEDFGPFCPLCDGAR